MKADVGRHGCGGVADHVAGGDGGGQGAVRPTPSSSSTLVQPIGRSPRATLPVFKTQNAGELCCSDGGTRTLLSPAASGVANIRSPGPSSSSRPITELATSSCRPFSQSERVKQLLLCGGLENALPGLVFHHQPSDGFHPSLTACTKDPAFALFSSGWQASWPSSLTGLANLGRTPLFVRIHYYGLI